MKSKKGIIIIVIVLLAIVGFAMGGGDDQEASEDASSSTEVKMVDVSKEKIKSDDTGKFVRVSVPKEQATDLSALQDIYQDFYKPNRDDGNLDYIVLDYDDTATFFSGVNVYVGCEMVDNFPSIKKYDKWYRTGSNDGLLSEVKE